MINKKLLNRMIEHLLYDKPRFFTDSDKADLEKFYNSKSSFILGASREDDLTLNERQKKGCNIMQNQMSPSDSFLWDKTKEGFHFWKYINQRLVDISKK